MSLENADFLVVEVILPISGFRAQLVNEDIGSNPLDFVTLCVLAGPRYTKELSGENGC